MLSHRVHVKPHLAQAAPHCQRSRQPLPQRRKPSLWRKSQSNEEKGKNKDPAKYDKQALVTGNVSTLVVPKQPDIKKDDLERKRFTLEIREDTKARKPKTALTK